MLKARGGEDRCRAVVLFTSHPSVGKTAIWSHFLAPRCSNAACTQPFTVDTLHCAVLTCSRGTWRLWAGSETSAAERTAGGPSLAAAAAAVGPSTGPSDPRKASRSLRLPAASLRCHRASSSIQRLHRSAAAAPLPVLAARMRNAAAQERRALVSLHNASRGGSGTTSAHPPPPGHAHSCPLPLFNHARPLTTMILVVTPESALRGT